MKYIHLSICLTLLLFACERDHFNPYDRDCSADVWTPADLELTETPEGISLTWQNRTAQFDGYMIERSFDHLNWQQLNEQLLSSETNDYFDTIDFYGETLYYRLYGQADLNISDTIYSEGVMAPIQLPQVETMVVILNSEVSATFQGQVLDLGGGTMLSYGFLYSSDPDFIDQKLTIESSFETNPFQYVIQDLDPGTTYYLMAYGVNERGIDYGEVLTFSTDVILPTLSVDCPRDISNDRATIALELSADGGDDEVVWGYVYGLNDSLLEDPSVVEFSEDQTKIDLQLENLEPGGTYYFKAFARNSAGTVYSNILRFTCEGIDQSLWELLGEQMPIYYGDSPPDISGHFTVDNFKHISFEGEGITVNHSALSLDMVFAAHHSCSDFQYSESWEVINVMLAERIGQGNDVYVMGNEQNFTAYFKQEQIYYLLGGLGKKSYTVFTVISGTRTETGFEDLYYALRTMD